MNNQYGSSISIIIAVSLLCSSIGLGVNAQTGDFKLEAEQNWDTYGVGGTCVYGTNNIFVGDVDSDVMIIKEGYISITPLHRDLTDFATLSTQTLQDLFANVSDEIPKKAV